MWVYSLTQISQSHTAKHQREWDLITRLVGNIPTYFPHSLILLISLICKKISFRMVLATLMHHLLVPMTLVSWMLQVETKQPWRLLLLLWDPSLWQLMHHICPSSSTRMAYTMNLVVAVLSWIMVCWLWVMEQHQTARITGLWRTGGCGRWGGHVALSERNQGEITRSFLIVQELSLSFCSCVHIHTST